MYFIVAFCITYLVLSVFKDFLKKNAGKVYIGLSLISIVFIYIYWWYLQQYNSILHKDIMLIAPLYSGAFCSSLFVMVMYLGAFKKPNAFTKKFMILRSEMSILATIFTFIHNITMLIYIKVAPVTQGTFGIEYMFGAITFVLMFIIMIPLFITSFTYFKKKMGGKKWKKLQRFAYPFYFLMYLQVLCINTPAMLRGSVLNGINVVLYSIVFITYFILRVNKALTKKSK